MKTLVILLLISPTAAFADQYSDTAAIRDHYIAPETHSNAPSTTEMQAAMRHCAKMHLKCAMEPGVGVLPQ